LRVGSDLCKKVGAKLSLKVVTIAGFTLLEMMMVLVLMGLLTALTLPLFSGTMTQLEMRKTVQEMVSVVRHAREKAVLEQAPQWVGLDLMEDYYWLEEGYADEEIGSVPEGEKFSSLPRQVDLKHFEWMGGGKESERAWIQFYPDGSSSGGSITLVNRSGNRAARISLNPFTGLVRVVMRKASEGG